MGRKTQDARCKVQDATTVPPLALFRVPALVLYDTRYQLQFRSRCLVSSVFVVCCSFDTGKDSWVGGHHTDSFTDTIPDK